MKLTGPQERALRKANKRIPGYEHTGWEPYGAAEWGLAARMVRMGLLRQNTGEWRSRYFLPTQAGLDLLAELDS